MKQISKITVQEINLARFFWQHRINSGSPVPIENPKNQLKTAREKLMLSTESVGKKLNISRAALCRFEQREAMGTISIDSLEKIANAMNCELIYEIKPRNEKSFEDLIWEQILPIALKHSWIRNCDQLRRPQALVKIALDLMSNPKSRRELGWAKNRFRN